jgi:hypothetical protein
VQWQTGFKNACGRISVEESIEAYAHTDSDQKEKNLAMPDANTIPWKQGDASGW